MRVPSVPCSCVPRRSVPEEQGSKRKTRAKLSKARVLVVVVLAGLFYSALG
jgi:hypothetical protein